MKPKLNPENVKLTKISLAKYFMGTDIDAWVPVGDVISAVKISGFRKNEIKVARKQLHIESQNINGVYHWKWNKQEDSKEV
jgi:hypothetical protein